MITGTANAAPTELAVVRIGDATLRQVRADVMRTEFEASVQGTRGLNRFAGNGVPHEFL